MSLRVWLPLTKDLRQQGLDNVTVTNNGATFNSAGKLGGCYAFNGSSNYLTIPQGYIGTNWSYSIWFYTTSTSATQTLGCCRTAAGSGFSIFLIGGKIRIDPGANNIQWTTNYTYTANTWTHLTVTCAAGAIKYYINGEYKESYSVTLASNQWGSVFSIGASQANGSGYGNYLNGRVNDVRIYNHCLSPMEVKQISQGLVLHYPLNRNGFGQENLLLNSSIEKTGASNSAQWFRWNVANPMLSSNHTYTLSFDAKMSNSTDVFYIGWANADSTQITMQEGVKVTDEYKRYSFTGQTTRTNINSFVISNYKGYRRGNENNTTGVLSIKNIKLEEGSIATPWCPNSSDILATTMGLNSTTEYDCSGFCNNGIKNNLPTYSSDTAKYVISTHVNGINQTIQIPNLSTLIHDDIYTFNIWFKRLSTEPSSKPWETILGGPSGFELETCSANNVHDNKIKAYSWGSGTFEFELDKWNMLTLVRTASDSKFYLNGELKLTGTRGAIPSGNYFLGSWRDTSTQNYKGYLSDARIYTTALSADDVKNLYQNSAYISSNGTAYAHEFVEV